MSEINSIGQKLAEQMAKNAQQEAGKPSEGDVAKFQDAMSQMNTQEVQKMDTVKLPGPADVQSVSSDYATKTDKLFCDSFNDMKNGLPDNLSPDISKGVEGLRGRMQDAQRELSAIAQDTSLSANEAASKVEKTGNGVLDYIKNTITDYQNMRANFDQKAASIGSDTSPTELLKLQKDMNDIQYMTSLFTSAANSISTGLKTMLQQQ
jgi:hypothetical protein